MKSLIITFITILTMFSCNNSGKGTSQSDCKDTFIVFVDTFNTLITSREVIAFDTVDYNTCEDFVVRVHNDTICLEDFETGEIIVCVDEIRDTIPLK